MAYQIESGVSSFERYHLVQIRTYSEIERDVQTLATSMLLLQLTIFMQFSMLC